MICKYCGKPLKKPDVEKCPHCKKTITPDCEGNGFYDMLTPGVVKSADLPQAAVETKKEKSSGNAILYILSAFTCVAAIVTVCVFIILGIKVKEYQDETKILKERIIELENEIDLMVFENDDFEEELKKEEPNATVNSENPLEGNTASSDDENDPSDDENDPSDDENDPLDDENALADKDAPQTNGAKINDIK